TGRAAASGVDPFISRFGGGATRGSVCRSELKNNDQAIQPDAAPAGDPAVGLGSPDRGHLARSCVMKSVLPLFIFIDACGWEIIRNNSFASDVAPNRRRLDSVLGYSSACVPSILSGCWPQEHRNWCYFVYDPRHSPFKGLRALRWLPAAVTSRRLFRRWLSRFVRAHL